MRVAARSAAALGLVAATVLAVPGGDLPAATRPAPGKLLVAVPRLPDPNFSRTVVLLMQYDSRGAMGLVINRRTVVPISRLAPQLHDSPRLRGKVFAGGPVHPNGLSMLVRSAAKPEKAKHVFDDVYFSRSSELLMQIVAEDESETPFRIYAGHAGWGPGQLDAEIERGDWIVRSADTDAVFHDDDRLWQRMLPPDPNWSAENLDGTGSSLADGSISAPRFLRPVLP